MTRSVAVFGAELITLILLPSWLFLALFLIASLQGLVEAQQWEGYTLSQQQEIFEAVLLLAGKGEWGALEAQLRWALEVAE